MPATILQIFQFKPIVPQQQTEFPGPWLRAGQISKKGPGTGANFFFLTHGRCSRRLWLGLYVPGVVRDDVQLTDNHYFIGGKFFGTKFLVKSD